MKPLHPTKPKAIFVEGKGKDKVVEPPSEKQKLTVIPDPRQALPAPEVTARPGVDVAHRITLNQAANTSDDALASRTVASVVHSLNLLGGEFWDKLHGDNTSHLVELGMYAAILVSPTSIISHVTSLIFTSTLKLFSSILNSEYAKYPSLPLNSRAT